MQQPIEDSGVGGRVAPQPAKHEGNWEWAVRRAQASCFGNAGGARRRSIPSAGNRSNQRHPVHQPCLQQPIRPLSTIPLQRCFNPLHFKLYSGRSLKCGMEKLQQTESAYTCQGFYGARVLIEAGPLRRASAIPPWRREGRRRTLKQRGHIGGAIVRQVACARSRWRVSNHFRV